MIDNLDRRPAAGDDPALNSSAARKYYGGVSAMTQWRWEKEERFPPPDFVLNRKKYWRRSTLNVWLDQLRKNSGER
jgi:predicted DNA-binding transcriptional regulator AlpA